MNPSQEIQELPPYIRHLLQRYGITELYPPQREALKHGLLEKKCMMVATPTASGKTLIAMMAAAKHLAEGGKVLYLTPLRALAAEKLAEFTRFFEGEYRVVASTGDYDSADPWLGSYDVIVATNEKADSLLRHKAPWIKSVTLLVADEVHLMGDGDRGPTLEMALTRLRVNNPGAQLLALSATAPNAEEIAEWLGAELITSDWRPVPLREGIYLNGEVVYSDKTVRTVEEVDYNPAISIALGAVKDGGQVIVFANTRRRAEQYAEKAAAALNRHSLLDHGDRQYLEITAEEMLQSTERSAFTERVAELLKQGACFHHAGLGAIHRRVVEKAFREKHLKILCATPTLAAGVNLPARVVLIPELRRYEIGEGIKNITVTEYKQFCGRAGRPGYDVYGEAITFARSDEEFKLIFDKYVRGKPERIWSRLGSERHMRAQVLAVLASEEVKDLEGLDSFFSKTLFHYQFGGAMFGKTLKTVLEFLVKNGFVVEDRFLSVTRLGRRVAELYIDPLSAITIIKTCAKRPRNIDELGLLQVVCMTNEVPPVQMRRVEAGKLARFVEENFDSFFYVPDASEDPEGYELFLESVKTAIVMRAWIDEVSEAEIYERMMVEPGDLAVLRERCGWMAYSASQLMAVEGNMLLKNAFEVLSERLAHGVRPELLQLTSLEGVGRVRARNLYNAGYRTLEDLRRASVEELAMVHTIGPKTAELIKKQL
jgi:helicase